ncbi:MAG: hypothetical protein KAV99_07150 [Candidatus Latescibacteria bacterium]|nr:hypothetical protein [Candidatus Latescibacterota bacterium]
MLKRPNQYICSVRAIIYGKPILKERVALERRGCHTCGSSPRQLRDAELL